MKKKVRLFLLVVATALLHSLSFAQTQNASVKINKELSFQKVTGFGGFVNSPQFGYNHMTEAEIRKMWGANSEAGYNIMRLYIPTGTNNWAQVIPTAQLAKSLGLKIFASPWSMPVEWKTDPIIGSVFTDEFGVKRNVYLKEEYYAAYANYLNDFVQLLRNNGVELDAISIQNEPDYQVDYAGCIFTPAQMTKFLKENRHLISCKVIAPETVGMPDNYANAFNAADVLPHFDIFGGHQYGAIQNGIKNLQANGKETWMTEYLINWNANGANRDFNWPIDAFDFANSVNDAMLANINAWVHYATKRYYAMMGDGTFGTPSSEISKRGRILSHFAKYVVGSTRIGSTWNDNAGILKGSSYLSATGDSVFVVVINPSANTYNLTLDLPFLSTTGKAITTTQTQNMVESNIALAAETNRPKVVVSPSSITTLIFKKSGNLTPSLMTGALVNYAMMDSITPTYLGFGNMYKLSGKTAAFSVNDPLISTNQNGGNGYLPLAHKFNRLVFRVQDLSSAGSFTSANTTLHYINAAGVASSYNYGTVSFDQRNNFDWVIDISENVLTDGCTGIIGLTNGNYVSILTFKFNNVFFAVGTERGYKFAGPYSNTDGNLLDCLDDITYTSLDLKNTTGIPVAADWDATATNKNSVYFVTDNSVAGKNNVVVGETCDNLVLRDLSGNFYPQYSFTASSAKYTATINGYKMLVLPFTANIPAGVTAYNIEFSDAVIKGKPIENGIMPANKPVLVKASGTFVFEGSGAIAPVPNLQAGIAYGIYIGVKIPQGAYYLTVYNNEPSFARATSPAQPMINAFDVYLTLGTATNTANLQVLLEEPLPVTFGDFTVQPNASHIQLKWSAYNESNNKGFYIERSTDGIVFVQIGFVNALANANAEGHYSFTDKNPLAGINYYRIKQTDIDGAYSYSQIKSAQLTNKLSISLYPNPVTNLLTIDGNGRQLSGVIRLYDAVGRIVLQSKLAGTNTLRLDVSKLPAGLYYYRFNTASGSFTKL